MTFQSNDYLNWYMPRLHSGDSAINLHSSGVAALDLRNLEPAAGDPWTMVGRFEADLAAWLGIPAQELCFTPGATGGTLLALLTLSTPGDELLVEQPIYEPMRRQAERLNPVRRFARSLQSGWRLPLDELKDTISDRTAVVMITEPSNPSRTLVPREEILQLSELAARHRATLLINEVYRGFTDAPSYHGEADNIVVVSSLSKLLGTYGLRLGWLSASSKLVNEFNAAHMNMSMASHPGAAMGIGVLKSADTLTKHAKKISLAGQEIVDEWIHSIDDVKWNRPMGPGFGCISLPHNVGNELGFVEQLHDERGVLVIPGLYFEAPGTIRLSWLQSGDRLKEGLAIVARAISEVV